MAGVPPGTVSLFAKVSLSFLAARQAFVIFLDSLKVIFLAVPALSVVASLARVVLRGLPVLPSAFAGIDAVTVAVRAQPAVAPAGQVAVEPVAIVI